METRELKVNISKTNLIVMDREPAVRPQRGRYPCGICDKGVGANSIWCQCYACVKGGVPLPQRLEVGEDSLEIVDNFRYVGDVISCEGGVESAVMGKISCAWSKWRELAGLLVNHSIPLE